MSDDYTPTVGEMREYVETGGEPRPWVELDEAEEARERFRAEAFDRMIAQVRAETLKGLLSEFGEWADEMTLVVGDELGGDTWRDTTVREYITRCIDEIEKEADQ